MRAETPDTQPKTPPLWLRQIAVILGLLVLLFLAEEVRLRYFYVDFLPGLSAATGHQIEMVDQ